MYLIDGKELKKAKSSISKAQSYKEIGEFWDSHDLADYWDQTEPAEFEVEILLHHLIDRRI